MIVDRRRVLCIPLRIPEMQMVVDDLCTPAVGRAAPHLCGKQGGSDLGQLAAQEALQGFCLQRQGCHSAACPRRPVMQALVST